MRIILILLCLSANFVFGQTDLGSWSSVSALWQSSEKLSLKLRPIVRHNMDLSSYANSSIDFSLAYKINSQWTVLLLERHWFIPEAGDREFLFFDVKHQAKLSSKLNLQNRLRWHLALDISGVDEDYIRYEPTFKFKTNSKFTPFVAADFFIAIGSDRTSNRVRYVLGTVYKISEHIGINFQFWHQSGITDLDFPKDYILVLDLAYRID